MQEDISNTCRHLDASKVRMLVPFLRKMGYITNDGFKTRNEIVKMNNLFTQEGKVFIEYLKFKIFSINVLHHLFNSTFVALHLFHHFLCHFERFHELIYFLY